VAKHVLRRIDHDGAAAVFDDEDTIEASDSRRSVADAIADRLAELATVDDRLAGIERLNAAMRLFEGLLVLASGEKGLCVPKI
jgi:hypothetical protein